MSLDQIWQNLILFFQTYPLAGFGLFLVVVFMLLMNRREGKKLLVIGLLLAAVIAAISYFSATLDTGIQQKDEMIYKTERALK